MTSSATLIILGLLASVAAAPWPADLPKCARECSIAGSPKLAYASEKTYTYSYSGKSEIHMKDVEGGVSQVEWTSQVDMSWLTPCEMAITFKNPSFGGASGTPEARFLTRYPLVVAMTDGRVQHVCSHPDDDTWSINLKKGVASAFQNSLPSNSSVNSGLNFTETDVAGKCPTLYEVQNQGEKVIVEKKKNHRFCQERFPSQAETPMSWMKAPLPVQESQCKCKQEITKGIYTSITCEDTNIIKPAFGSYKYVEAKQVSKLEFQSETANAPQSLSNIRGHMVHRSLRYDHEALKKDPSKVPELEEVLKQVCEKTKRGVEKETASLVDKAIDLMRRVPEEAVEQMLQKVKSGQICSEQEKMESLFLDAVAFVQEASTVKFMVREIMSSRTSGGRTALYTAALYFTSRPSLRAVEAVKPLFEQSERFPMASLAAATMVNTYCKHNPHCAEEAPVRQAAEALSQKIQQQCSSSGEESQKACLASIKSLGNMGVMTSAVARTVIEFIEKQDAEKYLRVAAAQAFRNVRCEREFTQQLVRIAVDPKKNTEIRIASYLAAVNCTEEEDLMKITDKLSKEENTQVRGFILSHLINLQKSSAPHKERLRYILSSISVPTNYSQDFRQYSRNIDLSYYAPSLGIGAGVESNIIYAPRSFVPRSVNLNLTSALGATPVNFGEFGARIEGLEPMLERLFGPEGYFQKSSISKVFRDISEYAEEKGSNILEHVTDKMRERRSIDLSTLSHFFSRIYGEQHFPEPRADIYARFNGQEVAYASITKALLQSINSDRVIDSFFDIVNDALRKMSHMKADTARALQMSVDYSLPTIQGIPLQMKLNGTAVVGLKMESNLHNLESGSPSLLKVIPSISAEVNGFIGYNSFIAVCGVKTKNLISSNDGISINVKGGRGFELELDIPVKMEVLNVKSETYLMKVIKGQAERRIDPSGVRHSRVQRQHCFQTLEQKIGLKVCYDINVPDILRSEGLPLGPPAFAMLTIEKSESSIRGYKVKADVQNSPSKKEVKLVMETPGSSTPRKAEGHISYSHESDAYKVEAAVSSQASGGMKMELNTKYSESEKELEFKAYSSRNQQFSPDTEVLEAKFSSRFDGQESKILLLTQTKNTLKSYIDHQFEVRGDLEYSPRTGLSYPRRLEKFALRTLVRDFKIISSVEKKSESEYSTVFKVGSRDNDKVAVEATHNIEGSWDEGFAIKTATTAKFGSAQYKSNMDLYNTREKIGTSMKVIRSQESSKVMELEAFVAKSGQSHKVKFQVKVPEYIRAIKFETNLEEQGSHRYQLQAALKHGSEVIFNADGPITAKFTYSMKQIQADVRIQTSVTGPHTVSSDMIWARNKQVLSFELKNQQEALLALAWNLAAEGEEETKAAFKILIPSVIDNRMDAIVSRKHIQISFNTVVSPKSSARRMKGFADVDFENKKTQAEFSWDADKDPSKKLSIESAIASSSSSPQQTILHGGCTYIGSTYHYKAEIRRSDPEAWLFGRKEIKVELTTPSQKSYALDTELDVQGRPSNMQVNAQIKYKNPQNKEFKVTWIAEKENLGRPYSFKVSSKTDIVSPEGQQTSLSLEAKHDSTSSQREAFIQIQIRSPSLSKPLQTSFTLMHQPSSYRTEWKVETADAAQYELRLSPEGGVQEFKVGFNLKEVVSLLKAGKKIVGMESGSGGTREGASYLIHYERPSRDHHKVLGYIPSRKMEGEIKHSPSEYSFKFYPNKDRCNCGDRCECKYEISLIHSKTSSPWEEQYKYEGRIEHPSRESAKKIKVLYTRNEEKSQGTVTLDISPREDDKMTGTLESVKTARNSVMVEAKLTGKVLKISPRIKVAASYSPHTVGFDMLVEKTPSSRPSLIISAKYDRSSERNAAVAFTVKTEEGPAVEISGSVRPEEEPECNGLKISAGARSSVIGSFDIYSKLCKPGFMKVSLKKHSSDKAYIARIGVLELKDVELSLVEKDERSQEKKHLALLRLKLVSPTLVNAEAKYEKEECSNIWETLSENWSRVSSSAGSWTYRMSQEVLQESEARKCLDETRRLWEEAMEEARSIYNDLVNDNLFPSYETRQRWARIQFIQGTVSIYKQLWASVDELKKTMYTVIPSTIRSLKNKFSSLSETMNAVVIGGAQWMKTGEIPQDLRSLIDQVQSSPLWEDIKQLFSDLARMLSADMEAMHQIFEKFVQVFINDIEKIRQDILGNTRVQEIIDWIIHHLHFDELMTKKIEHALDKLVQDLQITSVQIRGNHVEVQIPLRQRVNSLPEAWKYISANPIPVPENVLRLYEALTLKSSDYIVWSYYTLLPRRVSDLLPPYNRTAMVVDGSEIMTFDGTILRAPRSPCKVVLAAFPPHSLVMEHPQSSATPQFTLKTTEATVVFTPDHKVKINGREVSGQETSEGKIKIMKSPEEIKVMSPYMTVGVHPRNNVMTVEVSGWTFGQIAGLLGTYDGEMGNDWAKSQGSRASSLQELVRSWQENQQCQTPSISLMSASQAPALRAIHCQALLGVRSRCNAVVRPEPFMKMCYTSRNACGVAKAYRDVCSSKGVKDIFPPTC